MHRAMPAMKKAKLRRPTPRETRLRTIKLQTRVPDPKQAREDAEVIASTVGVNFTEDTSGTILPGESTEGLVPGCGWFDTKIPTPKPKGDHLLFAHGEATREARDDVARMQEGGDRRFADTAAGRRNMAIVRNSAYHAAQGFGRQAEATKSEALLWAAVVAGIVAIKEGVRG